MNAKSISANVIAALIMLFCYTDQSHGREFYSSYYRQYAWELEGFIYFEPPPSQFKWSDSEQTWKWANTSNNGVWTYSFITYEWFPFVFSGWNYFLPISEGEYYYYNYSIGAWYFMSVEAFVWSFNYSRGRWAILW